MNIIITILEDQQTEIDRLKKLLAIWRKKTNFDTEIRIFYSGESYFNDRTIPENSQVFFLDIQMDELSGIDVAKRLRQDGYTGYIIFLTAFREYVFHGYEVHALNYLLKPVQQESLFLCLNEIADDLAGNSYLYRNKQEIIRIPYKDILCFSSSLHYVDILAVSNTYCQYSTLNNIIGYLPNEFIRTHRSYIVNMTHIYRISGNEITLSNNMSVPIGRSYSKNVIDSFSDYSFRLDIKGGYR